MPKLEVDKIIVALRSPKSKNRAALKMVMTPYVASLNARLDALAPIHKAIQTFVKSLNDFFSFKQISFLSGKGFAVTGIKGEPLSLEQLSSGEQQLLLIYCYALAAGDGSSILIIDEPEISLNIKWQRKLVDSLKQLTKASQNQLVFATHSIELLAQHSDRVHSLIPKTIENNEPVYEHPAPNS